jgi:hypothetical protein
MSSKFQRLQTALAIVAYGCLHDLSLPVEEAFKP